MKTKIAVLVLGSLVCLPVGAEAGGSNCSITPGNRSVHIVGCKGSQNRTPTLPPGQANNVGVCQGDEITWEVGDGRPSGQAMVTISFDKGDRVSPTDPQAPTGDGAATARIRWDAARNRDYQYSIAVTGCAAPLDPGIRIR